MASTQLANSEEKPHQSNFADPKKDMAKRGAADDGSSVMKQRHAMDGTARDPMVEPEPPVPTEVPRLEGEESQETTSLGLVMDFDGLSRPRTCVGTRASVGTRARLEESPEEGVKRLGRMRDAVRTLLECVGEDPDRPGLLDTPERYSNAMMFLTTGYGQNVRDMVNNAIFQEGHTEMVVVKDIDIFSICEHHLLPFTGKMHIGYVPYHSVIGLSKLPRIAEMFSRRLQIQERLTADVANAVMEVLRPQGVAVVMESSHLCMVMRGVEKSAAVTITSCVRGCFETNKKTMNEFLSLVGAKR